MTDFIVSLIAKILNLLPDANNTSALFLSVSNSFAYFNSTIGKINIFFPVYTLFSMLAMVLVVEIIIFLVAFIFKLRALI